MGRITGIVWWDAGDPMGSIIVGFESWRCAYELGDGEHKVLADRADDARWEGEALGKGHADW